MKASKKLIEKLKEFEGLRLEAYCDEAGVPTIGYGHTGDVKLGDRISVYWAEELLRRDLSRVEAAVEAMGVASTQGQFDALVSFAFNLGPARLERSSLLKCIRQEQGSEAIVREWMRWVYAGGRRMAGLERRRSWEAERFFESDARQAHA